MHIRGNPRQRSALLAGVVAGLLAGSAPQAAEIEPLQVQLNVQGQPYAGENCEGGDWSLTWRGDLPGESNTIGDLLISYSAFDTTNESDRVDPPARVTVKPVTCRDDNGAVVLHAALGGGTHTIRGVAALKHDPAHQSPFFDFTVDDIGTCHITSPMMKQELENATLHFRTGLLASIAPELNITREELEQGFTKRFALGGQVVSSAFMCMGTPIERGELILSYKQDNRQPSIGLSGCAHLARGASTTVTANVQPAGGTVRFSADPAATVNLRPTGNSVAVTGATPGRATLKGEYTYNGRTATATLPASSVELISVNSGAPIPKLGLMGTNGLPHSRVYPFPFQSNPGDAGDLLIFAVENEALASVVTNRSSIGIQPVREGRTRIQAKTACGVPIGPPIEIEIATCDEQTRNTLEQQKQDLARREQELVRRITQLVADPEFQRAATEIKDTTITLATKTAELIAATLTVRDARAVKLGRGDALSLSQINTAQNLWSGHGIVNDAIAGNDWSATISAVAMALDSAGISALKAAVESGMAADKFGQDLGIIAGLVEQLENLEVQHDNVRRDLYRIDERLRRCDKLPPPPPLPPKKEPEDDLVVPLPPLPPVPPPNATEPTPAPAPDEPAPTPEEPPVIVDPPRGPVSGGLCVRRVDEPLTARDLQQAQTAVTQFKTVAQRGREIIEGFQATLRAMEATNSLSEAQRAAALRALAPQYNASMNGLLALGEAARAQEQRFEPCTAAVPAEAEKVRSGQR